MIVKDNYDTHDLPTTAGSLSLAESYPPDDAFQVRKIREAGAIVLAVLAIAMLTVLVVPVLYCWREERALQGRPE